MSFPHPETLRVLAEARAADLQRQAARAGGRRHAWSRARLACHLAALARWLDPHRPSRLASECR
jgi:hypothetical protein